MALPTLNGLALCAGVGMLDEGVRLAFEYLGRDYRTVCYVEREAAAAAQLVALMESGCLDPAPVWSDLTTFDTRRWRGLVDCVSAGFPCQPHSVAGKREGLEDARWIWPDIARLIGELRPGFVTLENVPGLASTGGLDAVIGDLAARGYSAEWARLSARAVGASHERERLFILGWLADDDGEGCGEHGSSELLDRERPAFGRDAHGCNSPMEDTARHERAGSHGKGGRRRRVREAGDELVNAHGAGRPRPGQLGETGRPESGEPGFSVAIAEHGGQREGLAVHAPSESHDECAGLAVTSSTRLPQPESGELRGTRGGVEGRAVVELRRAFAPGPSDEVWEAYCSFFPFLAPAVESGVCVLVDGLALVVDESRTDQLRAIGNGVVALTAACAYVELARRAGVAE